VHVVKAPASIAHSNVEPGSFAVKLKLTLAPEGSDGLAVIVVSGGVVSTVQV
jgi:hypothetical protein